MVDAYKKQFETLIAQIVDHLPKDASDTLRQFVKHYFHKMPLMDLEQLDAKWACQIAADSFDFFTSKTESLQTRVIPSVKKKGKKKAKGIAIEVHNDDMPFILDSLMALFNRLDCQFHDIVHPIFYLKRNKDGSFKQLVSMGEEGDVPSGTLAESFIHFELDALPAGYSEEKLIEEISSTLNSVELVVQDWRAMSQQVPDVIKQIRNVSKYFDAEELKEAEDFLNWINDKNFVFLGYVEYDFFDKDGNECLNIVDGSEMGIFKMADEELKPKALAALPPEVLHFAREPKLIEVTKSNHKSIVHRPVHMDYVTIKRFNSGGNVIGESRFLGLFTSIVYYQSADRIPFIRRKIARTLRRANFDPMSHNGKSLKAILEFYPRDELFQISEDDLFNFSVGLISLETRPEVKLFARRDRFERFMSCMVYIPRERFSSYLREQIRTLLETRYNGVMTAFYTQLSDSPLARLHIIIKTVPGQIPDVSSKEIEDKIAKITNKWGDSVREELLKEYEADEVELLHQRFGDAFPESYINSYDAIGAVKDIGKAKECVDSDGLAVDLFQLDSDKKNVFHLKIFTYQAKRALSDMLPILENLGCTVMEVNPFTLTPKWKHGDILIRDFTLEMDESLSINLKVAKPYFEETLRQVWREEVANDAFNALVLAARLSCRETEIVRSYSHYLRQVGFAYSQHYVAEALAKHPILTRTLVDAFLCRFDPEGDNKKRDSEFKSLIEAIDKGLNDVSNIAEDRIIRRFVDLITASLRTNYFQTDEDGKPKSYLSVKFRSKLIPDLPEPVPYAEIFVYSMRTEGIHLRGGAVARGGLRWSDRPEDFRTEILGLVKAQMVKNAVIVPHGAKGGFVVKQPPASGARDDVLKEGIACYRQFLSGLLDITDNIVDDNVVTPDNVVRMDGDDPYLVVAADKGTATFSDIANELSLQYGFWLGDAFASGGSAGYDHKAMGITARGAWVSVERHFREMGIDTQSEDFTVVGIGDMSGDVFGNGMLLSEHIKLVGAFNHRHIFIDPDPNAKKSFAERQRLFELPRSSWEDYDSKLISSGGGIFARDQKKIPLSKEIQKLLDTKQKETSPEELIQMLLKAKVDLLWNGGIGTYVKASYESHAEVGDRHNNSVRVDATELRCKVVGEGGNLGMTQLARIEYAQNGGRINTDAIDNSAGVDCSDHEVNIKIALRKALDAKKLDMKKRDVLLEDMTDEVSRLVLIDNRLQTQALTISQYHGYKLLEPLTRMMHDLEGQNFLDRKVEFLPSDKQISELRAKKQGLTRPELSVLLSYSKLALYRDLCESSMVMSDYFATDLLRYFPKPMQKDYKDEILSHRLRGEIVATIITNSIINRAGITFAHTMQEETGMHPCDIARAYVISRDAFNLRSLWNEIERQSGKVSAGTQAEMFAATSHFLERTSLWFLENCPEPLNIEQIMDQYAKPIQTFMECFESLLSKTLDKAYRNQMANFTNKSVPEDLAKRIAGLEVMSSACDIAHVANQFGLEVQVAGRIYFELGAQLRLGWMRRCASHITTDVYWDQLAIKSLIRELYTQQRRLTTKVLETLCSDNACDLSVENWHKQNEKELVRYYRFIDDLKAQETVDLSMLIVAARQVESICAL